MTCRARRLCQGLAGWLLVTGVVHGKAFSCCLQTTDAWTFTTRSPKKRDEKMRAQGWLAVVSVCMCTASCGLAACTQPCERARTGVPGRSGCERGEWLVAAMHKQLRILVLRHCGPWVLFSSRGVLGWTGWRSDRGEVMEVILYCHVQSCVNRACPATVSSSRYGRAEGRSTGATLHSRLLRWVMQTKCTHLSPDLHVSIAQIGKVS